MESSEVKPTSMRRGKPYRRWTTEEVSAILTVLKDVKSSVSDANNPMENLDDLCQMLLTEIPIANCSLGQIKSKLRNLRGSYLTTFKWINKSGPDVVDKEGYDYLKTLISRQCPFYDDLDEIYGSLDLVLKESVSNIKMQKVETLSRSVSRAPSVEEQLNEVVDLDLASQRGISDVNVELEMKKLEFSNKKLDFEKEKLEFEKEKWQDEKMLKKMELDLEKKKAEENARLARHELAMKTVLQVCERY